MNGPNFFIVGASKSGTTSLYHYLNQHPEIFMCPEKEPSFFINHDVNQPLEFPKDLLSSSFIKRINQSSGDDLLGMDDYLNLFKGAEKEKIIGEASTDYLIFPSAAQAIHDFDPNAKIMVILRNPFDAAYSEYLMQKRNNELNSNVSFLSALRAEASLDNENMQQLPKLIRTRLYDRHIGRYLNLFPRSQMKFILFEELADMERLLIEMFEFLQVFTKVEIDYSLKYNTKNIHENNTKLLAISRVVPNYIKLFLKKNVVNYFPRINSQKLIHQTVKCPQDAKEFLRPTFIPVINKIEIILGKDLSSWKL